MHVSYDECTVLRCRHQSHQTILSKIKTYHKLLQSFVTNAKLELTVLVTLQVCGCVYCCAVLCCMLCGAEVVCTALRCAACCVAQRLCVLRCAVLRAVWRRGCVYC
jgi:hypothetical protein